MLNTILLPYKRCKTPFSQLLQVAVRGAMIKINVLLQTILLQSLHPMSTQTTYATPRNHPSKRKRKPSLNHARGRVTFPSGIKRSREVCRRTNGETQQRCFDESLPPSDRLFALYTKLANPADTIFRRDVGQT